MNPDPQRIIRKVIPPGGAVVNQETLTHSNKSLKPAANSRNFQLDHFEYAFKAYLYGSKTFSYRCVNRNNCFCLLQIPLEDNFDEHFEFCRDKVQNYTYINKHSEECQKIQSQKEALQKFPTQIIPFQSDESYLESFVKENPLLEPKTIKVELLKRNKKFKIFEIVKKLQEVRGELFPKDKEHVFSSIYCKALDSPNPIFNLFRAYIKLPFISKNSSIIFQESVILMNNPMMMKLHSEQQWFIDGTFKVAPMGFKQILNVLVYLPKHGIFYPGAHILMTNKTQISYSTVFSCLKSIGSSINCKLEPGLIMTDFELALRNALKEVFPKASLSGCYFHFSKALWDKISKLGLRRKEFKQKSLSLIAYLQIVAHCPLKEREQLFEEVQEIFKEEDKRFKTFFNYFKKEWLKNPFLDVLFKSLNEDEDLNFIRTNNPCEQFHNFLGIFSELK